MGGLVSWVTDDVLGFDPGGGGIYDVARDVLGDDLADDVLGFDPNGGGIVPLTNTAANVAVSYLIGQGIGSAFAGADAALAGGDAAFAAADAAQLANQGLSQAQIAATLQSTGLTASQAAAAAAAGYDAAFVAADAAQLAEQGLSSAAIEQNLIGAGVDPFVAADAAQLASSGVGASGITQNLLQSASGMDDLFSGGTTLQDGSFINKAGQLFDSAGNFVKELTTGEIGQLLGQAGQAYISDEYLKDVANAQRQLGAETYNKAAQIGESAQVPFQPYTVTSGLGTSQVTPTSATSTLSQPLANIQSQLYGGASSAIGAIDPAQATQTMFSNLEALQAPERQRAQAGLLSDLGAKGLLGYSQNLPTVGGGVSGVNPYMESLLSAQATQQAQNALNAQQFGTQEAQRMASLGTGLLSSGTNLETLGYNQLGQAYNLGSGITTLEQANRQRAAEAALTGLKYQNEMNLNAADIEAQRSLQQAQAYNQMIGGITGTGTAGSGNSTTNQIVNAANTANALNNLYKTGSSLYNSVASLF